MDRLHEELKLPVTEICSDDRGSSDEDDYPINNGQGLLGGNASSDGMFFFRFVSCSFT